MWLLSLKKQRGPSVTLYIPLLELPGNHQVQNSRPHPSPVESIAMVHWLTANPALDTHSS